MTSVDIAPWRGPWEPDDPDANFKHEVALYAAADPLATLRALGENLGIPVGGLVHYVLARWASDGSATVLELGPNMIDRMWSHVAAAEADGTDAARLAGYAALKEMLAWLRLPLADD